MLYLCELRNICKLSDYPKQTFRTLLLAAAGFDKEILGEIFYKCDYSLSKFVLLLKNNTQAYQEEERLIIAAIKQFAEPTDLHLLFLLSNSAVPLNRELNVAGLKLDLLEEELNKRIASKNKIYGGNEHLNSSLTKIFNSQKN
ncbi:MAG: hypothetical protein NTX65_12680 [Ignavibacteriales bacterium]|nr:hypothetical protein [Ignavibacteriales bacterium]